MSSFLTVEDINTININEVINEFYEFDLAELGEEDYTDVQVDFLKVTFKKDYQGIPYYYEIKAYNSTISDILFRNSSYSRKDKDKIVVHSNHPVKIVVFLNSFLSSQFGRWYYLGPVVYLKKDEIGQPRTFTLYDLLNNYYEDSGVVNVQLGVNYLKPSYSPQSSTGLLCLLQKTDLQYTLSDTVLSVGKINHVRLNVDESYLPSGDLVDGDELDAIVVYNGQELPVYYDASVNDYCFDLDLTEKFDNKIVELTLKVYETEYINNTVDTLRLKCDYQTASNFKEFMSLVNDNVEIIRLVNDIVCEYSVMLINDIYIIGDGYNFDLNDYSIIFDKMVTVKLESINFTRGAPCLVQNDESKLTLIDCSFTDCKITDEYKGSVLSTLGDENIVSSFEDVSILNCPHSIWHNGELTLNKINAVYDNIRNIDTDYSILLNMPEGIVEITNSTFNIYFWDWKYIEKIDLKYAISLIGVGETVNINTILGSKLKDNNCLPLWGQFNNASTTDIITYYPLIEDYVNIVGVLGFENKSCCHTILGTDWVFKNNIELKRDVVPTLPDDPGTHPVG